MALNKEQFIRDCKEAARLSGKPASLNDEGYNIVYDYINDSAFDASQTPIMLLNYTQATAKEIAETYDIPCKDGADIYDTVITWLWTSEEAELAQLAVIYEDMRRNVKKDENFTIIYYQF